MEIRKDRRRKLLPHLRPLLETDWKIRARSSPGFGSYLVKSHVGIFEKKAGFTLVIQVPNVT